MFFVKFRILNTSRNRCANSESSRITQSNSTHLLECITNGASHSSDNFIFLKIPSRSVRNVFLDNRVFDHSAKKRARGVCCSWRVAGHTRRLNFRFHELAVACPKAIQVPPPLLIENTFRGEFAISTYQYFRHSTYEYLSDSVLPFFCWITSVKKQNPSAFSRR